VKTKGICGREAYNIPGDVVSPYLAVTALTVLFSPPNIEEFTIVTSC
jgi:hypothetical protein